MNADMSLWCKVQDIDPHDTVDEVVGYLMDGLESKRERAYARDGYFAGFEAARRLFESLLSDHAEESLKEARDMTGSILSAFTRHL